MTRRMILLIAVLALVAAACGGSGDDGSGVASLSTIDVSSDDLAAGLADQAEVDPEEALLDLTQCLRDEGIDIADPTVDAEGNPQLARPEFGENGPPEGFREAIQSCSEFLDGVTIGRQGQDLSEIQDTFVEFAACMRTNGYEMDDPDFSGFAEPGEGDGPGGGVRVFEFEEDDPEFQAAFEVCEEILAGFGPGRGGGIGGGRPGGGA